MEAYRDQYATLFNNGRDVVVIAISVDADTTLANWARESDFPMLFASDPGGRVGVVYDAFVPASNVDNRSLFVIGPDGRIVHRMLPFSALSPKAYAELEEVIDRVSPEQREEP